MTSTRSRSEEWHPLETFPEIVWIRIISHVMDFSDLIKLAEASVHLKRLVLEVYPSYEADMVFHLVAPYVRIAHLRKLRTVSSRWNEIAEKFLDHMQCDFDWESNSEAIVCLSNRSALERWSAEMNPAMISPSTCRSFVLQLNDLDNDVDLDEYHSLAIQHLATCGHHTWNLKILAPRAMGAHWYLTIKDATAEILSHLEFIRSCLEHVPNLKSLFIPTIWTSTANVSYNIPFFVDYQYINSWMKSHPFPRLRSLIRFYTPQFESVLTKMMLKHYQSQIQMLSLTMGSSLELCYFPSRICCCFTGKSSVFVDEFHEKVIRKMGKRSLTQLKVEFVPKARRLFSYSDNRRLWKDLLHVLQLLETNLKSLSIKVPWDGDASNPAVHFFDRVTLPKLKRFEIDVEDVSWLDSLATFAPNLKHFSLNPKREWKFGSESFFDKQEPPKWTEGDLVNLNTMTIHGIKYKLLPNDRTARHRRM